MSNPRRNSGLNPLKVSVLIVNYNCGEMIRRAVESVSKATYVPHEILVYDDASTDNSVDVVEELQNEIGYLRLFKGEVNQGAGHARQYLLKCASGTHAAFLDADDWWYENKLDDQIRVIRDQGFDIVTCGYDILDEDGAYVGQRMPLRNVSRLSIKLSNWIPMSMTIVNLSLIGAKDMPLIRRRQDYGYWLHLFEKNKMLKFKALTLPYGAYTRRRNSLSSRPLKNILYNYRLFRYEMQYSILLSITLVFINSMIRLLRK